MAQKQVRESTIRRRIVMLHWLVLGFIIALISAYTWQIFSLERRLEALENCHDLFDNVLELRRYEKNLLLGVGEDNLNSIIFYLDKIELDVAALVKGAEQVFDEARMRDFRANLEDYKAIFKALPPGGRLDSEKVRGLGKGLVDFSKELLRLRQEGIKQALKAMLLGFVSVTGTFFLFIMLALQIQAKSVLSRVSYVRQATKDLLRGNFTPIVDNAIKRDEVSDLILAFNKMAGELETKQSQLVQSRKLAAIGTFSSGIAHELNNPLNNISLSADTLLEDYDQLDEQEGKEIIRDIIEQTERASAVVKNLLDFSRDKAPSAALLDIKEVVGATVRLIANQLRLQAIWVEDYIPANLPPIKGDKQKLHQVFLNLFVNAIDVMPDGGLIFLEALETPDGYIQVNVNDTGSGIEPECIDHVFDPFYTTKAVGHGTGLGLSIVYGIVKKHGGYVEVKSKKNIGTTFAVFLPTATRAQQAEAIADDQNGDY